MYLNNIVVPVDTRIAQKAIKMCDKYVDLKIQIGRCRNLKSFVYPIIIGALGSVPKELTSNLNSFSLHTSINRTFQQSVLHTHINF